MVEFKQGIKEQLKQEVQFSEVFQRYYPGNFKGEREENHHCPFHDDENPSMKIDPDHGYCFSCKKRFDIFDLVEKSEGCGFQTAIELIAEEFGNDGGFSPKPTKKEEKKKDFAPSIYLDIESKEISPDLAKILDERKVSQIVQNFIRQNEVKTDGTKLIIPMISKNGEIVGAQDIDLGKTKGERYRIRSGSNMKSGYSVINANGSPTVITESFMDACSVANAYPECKVLNVFSADGGKLENIGGVNDEAVLFFDNYLLEKTSPRAIQEAIKVSPGIKIVDWNLAADGGKDVNDLLINGKPDLIKKMIDSASKENISLLLPESQVEASKGNVNDSTLDKEIEKLNEKHAVIMQNGKFSILNEGFDPVFNRPDISFSSSMDFCNFYKPQKVKDSTKSIADKWLESPGRRKYDGIVFSPGSDVPGYYNLWRGFAVTPQKGDWSLFRDHIFTVIASGDKKIFDYIIAWMTHTVQYPGGDRPGTSIVLRGKQGTGKGIFATLFGSLFGTHFLHITQQGQLTGRFNGHHKDALVLFCDEITWGGDKSAEGVLKGLITEHQIMIEQKGQNAFPIKNHIRLIVASNNDWVIPAGLEERRFLVLDVNDSHMQHHEYFKAIISQMDNGGREGMLHDLLRHDICGCDLRTIPRTSALFDQIFKSMSALEKFWYERLVEGCFAEYLAWEDPIPTHLLYDRFRQYAQDSGVRFRETDSEFGKKIKKLCDCAKRKKKLDSNSRVSCYQFPDLSACRKSFEALVNMEIQWDDIPEE